MEIQEKELKKKGRSGFDWVTAKLYHELWSHGSHHIFYVMLGTLIE